MQKNTSISEIITDILADVSVKNVISGALLGSCLIGLTGVLMILN